MTKQQIHAARAAALATTLAKMRAGVPLAVLVQPKAETPGSAAEAGAGLTISRASA